MHLTCAGIDLAIFSARRPPVRSTLPGVPESCQLVRAPCATVRPSAATSFQVARQHHRLAQSSSRLMDDGVRLVTHAIASARLARGLKCVSGPVASLARNRMATHIPLYRDCSRTNKVNRKFVPPAYSAPRISSVVRTRPIVGKNFATHAVWSSASRAVTASDANTRL